MFMKNVKCLSLLVILLMVFTLIGCSPPDDDAAETPPDDDAAETLPDDDAAETPPDDGEIELTLSTLFPEPHCTNQYLHYPLAEEIQEATNGRVKINIFPGATLGDGSAHYDMAVENSANITQGIQGFTPGRFPLTSVVELPFLFPTDMSAETANSIVWELFENVPELQAEYDDVKVLAIYVNEPGSVYTNKPIKTLEDFRGMEIRAPMETAASMLSALGANPVTMPTGDLYLSLERGVVDGTLFNTANMNDWRLWEVVDYYTEAGFYNLAWFTVMNKDVWNSLPGDVQEIIEAKYEMNAGLMVGRGFDTDYVDNIDIAQEQGVERYVLPADERERWMEATSPVHDQWVASMEQSGLPGEKVLNEIKRLIDEHK